MATCPPSVSRAAHTKPVPWKVQKSSAGEWIVVVSAGPKAGKVVARHPSKEAALRQVKALYANTGGEHR